MRAVSGPRYRWRLPEPLRDRPALPGFSAPIATLLARRGVRDEATLRGLLGGDASALHPLTEMADADAALDRIEHALAGGERIAVWGDYDADGITAVAIWLHALRAVGGDPIGHLPSRLTEGYGLSAIGLERVRAAGATLVITCDCGVTNIAEAALAARLGIDLVITDHHLPGAELPGAVAVVDPHRADCRYPNPDLTGAGVAFKLATALLESHHREAADVVALAAIGTVADIAPLVGENREIVRLGLRRLGETGHPGLRALLARAASDASHPTARDIAFGVAPRINAAGRIGDAELALALLLEGEQSRAASLAEQLEATNRERQAVTRTAVSEALAELARQHPAEDGAPLAIRNDDWPPGIIGLVAGRLTEALGRPVAAVTAAGDQLRGSVRAPDDFHVAEALSACRSHLLKLGGHRAAGGFSLLSERWDIFAEAFRALPRPFPVGAAVSIADPASLVVDLVLPAAHLGWPLCEELERLAPYGPGHPEPRIAISGLVLAEARRSPADEGRLALRFLRGFESFDGVAFDVPSDRPLPTGGTPVDVVASVERGQWIGEPRLRLRVFDFADAEISPLVARRAAAADRAPVAVPA